MAKDPAFLFYYQDFLVGTSFMSLEEVGAYIKLLCFQAAKGHLSKDNIIKKIPVPMWNNIKDKFLQDKEGNFYNDRLDKEIEKRKVHSEHQRQNAKMRWQCDGSRLAMPLENENENENVIKDKKDFITTLEEVTAYCKERKNNVDPNKWFDFYSAKGWMIGKNKMKDWKAAVRTWEQREPEQYKSGKTPAKIRVLSMRASKYEDTNIKQSLLSDGYSEAEIDNAMGRG
jgi:uncharacterized protein YdaU (DUF1376 family)